MDGVGLKPQEFEEGAIGDVISLGISKVIQRGEASHKSAFVEITYSMTPQGSR